MAKSETARRSYEAYKHLVKPRKGLQDAPLEWMDIDTLPPPGERPGRVFVIVEGSQFHSGVKWLRRRAGIARTQNDGFYPEDIGRIAADDQMDHGTEMVTHWLPWCLPPFPHCS